MSCPVKCVESRGVYEYKFHAAGAIDRRRSHHNVSDDDLKLTWRSSKSLQIIVYYDTQHRKTSNYYCGALSILRVITVTLQPIRNEVQLQTSDVSWRAPSIESSGRKLLAVIFMQIFIPV